MNKLEIPDKESLLENLADSIRRATEWFTSLPAETFFKMFGEEWPPAQNLDHLIRSVKPVGRLMSLPRPALQDRFGRATGPSRSYNEVCEVYIAKIAEGGAASGRFLPEQDSANERVEERKAELLSAWTDASAELVTAARGWEEAEFDAYQLPHPLLGQLTVREMLYFTIYHNLRHARLEGD